MYQEKLHFYFIISIIIIIMGIVSLVYDYFIPTNFLPNNELPSLIFKIIGVIFIIIGIVLMVVSKKNNISKKRNENGGADF